MAPRASRPKGRLLKVTHFNEQALRTRFHAIEVHAGRRHRLRHASATSKINSYRCSSAFIRGPQAAAPIVSRSRFQTGRFATASSTRPSHKVMTSNGGAPRQTSRPPPSRPRQYPALSVRRSPQSSKPTAAIPSSPAGFFVSHNPSV